MPYARYPHKVTTVSEPALDTTVPYAQYDRCQSQLIDMLGDRNDWRHRARHAEHLLEQVADLSGTVADPRTNLQAIRTLIMRDW